MSNSKSLIKAIEVTSGPAGTIGEDVLEFCTKYYDETYIVGEKLSFPNLKEKLGLRFIESKIVPIPDYTLREQDVETYGAMGELDTKMILTIHADATKYNKDDAAGNAELHKNIDEWIRNGSNYIKILNYEIESSTAATHVVLVTLLSDQYISRDLLGDIIESPFLDDVWLKYMNAIITEGVCYAHGKVPVKLRDDLRKHIDDLAKNSHVDYHPNSNDVVRDLVHPALYPYVKGISKTNVEQPSASEGDDKTDFWGRPYEDSKFQWLPTPFKISANGKCSILEYINNLDRKKFPSLYEDLENLFEIILPYFEEVWSYAKAMEFFTGTQDESDDESVQYKNLGKSFGKEKINLKDREVQVITKIVEYGLEPGQAYEGVWHAEGMSHENIVMTGIYFLDRDTDLEGGELRYKRSFTKAERTKIFWEIAQDRTCIVNQFSEEGFIPLGCFPTEEGYLLVFPNCHIHKISKMVNAASNKRSIRRIVVFFFINPEKKIISTREVPPQQDVISLANAKAYRLELMGERKYDKEKLNVRDIELCEH